MVIAIIAILAGMLLPSLAKAKYSGQRVACLNNIRQQYLCQIMFADDNTGKFPRHDDGSPDYHRTAGNVGQSIVDLMRGTYVKNTSILICPITRLNFGRTWGNYDSMSKFADSSTKDYGGWDTTASMVYTPYMWLANFTPTMKFLDAKGKPNADASLNEPAWPTKTEECDSRRAFITHTRQQDAGVRILGRWTHWADSMRRVWPAAPVSGWSITPDQPVGQADGSVVVRKKILVLPRATGGPGGETTYYY